MVELVKPDIAESMFIKEYLFDLDNYSSYN